MKKLLAISILLFYMCILSGCSSAGTYYKNAKESFAEGNYEEAETKFLKAIEKNPNRADYYIEYGFTLLALNKEEEAITQFDKIYLDKDIPMVRENNKKAYRGKGIAYLKLQQYEKAMEQFDLALSIGELSELDLDILYYKGKTQEFLGLYEEALESYSTILTKDETQALVLEARANIYRIIGDYKKSLDDYDKTLALNPKNFNLYFGKYFLLTEQEKEEEAKEVLEQAVKIDVITDVDQLNLAKLHYYIGDYEKANKEFEVMLQKGVALAQYFIGLIYEQQKDYANAIYQYENYINSDPENISATVYNQIGSCLLKTSDYKKALEYFEKGINCRDVVTMQKLKRNEIIAYEFLGKFPEALDKMLTYIENYPEDLEAVKEADFLRTRVK
ncbi:MAG: hypothetical protein K0S47_2947 [Herbinix sp.]|nr:hypothetical protein [Herbinix sp.]